MPISRLPLKREISLRALFLSAFLFLPLSVAAQVTSETPPLKVEAPSLKVEQATYKLESGVLDFTLTFVNSTDSVVFLDCQVQPKFSMAGKTLVLTLDRRQSEGKSATEMDAYPPQRIGAHQTFQAERRFDHILSEADTRPAFSNLDLRIGYYPERSEGEGTPFVLERAAVVEAKTVSVSRTGKIPAPTATGSKRRLKKPI